MGDMIEATAWLTLEPKFSRTYPYDAESFRVAKLTQSRPEGSRFPVVKVNLRLPAQCFNPLAPTVTIELPEDSLAWPEPEVTVDTGIE